MKKKAELLKQQYQLQDPVEILAKELVKSTLILTTNHGLSNSGHPTIHKVITGYALLNPIIQYLNKKHNLTEKAKKAIIEYISKFKKSKISGKKLQKSSEKLDKFIDQNKKDARKIGLDVSDIGNIF